jgi:hypothetical protein
MNLLSAAFTRRRIAAACVVSESMEKFALYCILALSKNLQETDFT